MILKFNKIGIFFLVLISVNLLAQDKPKVTIGGALRFNYNLSSWKDEQVKRGGDFGYDVFRINAKASYKGVKLNAEYRMYSAGFGGGMLKQGWIGYDFSEKNNLQIGLTQVPFGITQYNSHNWFFSINYYVGLEDDHDMGLKYTHTGDKFDYAIAFFKNAEELNFGNTSDISDSRYSYDIASKDLDGDGELDLRNKEINQFNAKFNYKIQANRAEHKLGASAQYGGVYNLDTKEIGDHQAFAGHYQLISKRLSIKAQAAYYNINAKNPEGETNTITAMTAYGYPYFVASEATNYTLGIAYTFPVEWGPISSIQIYDDFGYMDKANNEFDDTIMNVLGALITAGSVYTYVDFASGKHMPWLNPDFDNSLAQGSTTSDTWETRFNINIGYYF